MKTIKIRFIKYKDKYNYTIQRRGWFGWKDITYTINMGYGSVTYKYSAVTKEELLEKVLEEYYKVDKRFVEIIEYPTIKIY
jgi:hypothetical protein